MADERLHHNFRRRPKVVVEANGYSIWDISQQGCDFSLELTEHLEDDAISLLCGQFPLTADYSGEGSHGTIITLYNS